MNDKTAKRGLASWHIGIIDMVESVRTRRVSLECGSITFFHSREFECMVLLKVDESLHYIYNPPTGFRFSFPSQAESSFERTPSPNKIDFLVKW